MAMPTPNKHAGQDALRSAFAEGKRKAGNDDRNERKAAGDGAGECGLQNVDGVFPRGSSLLGEGWSGEKKRETDGGQW